MLNRFAILVLGSLLLLSSDIASAAPPQVQIVVPGFQYPQSGVTYTEVRGVANNGTVTGNTNLGSFLRYADGTFSPLFKVPGASITTATGVNSSNLVCGYYYSAAGAGGFFYDGTTFSYYSVSGATETFVNGINDSGDFCGYYDIFDKPSQRGPLTSAPEDYTGFSIIGGKFTTYSLSDAEAVFPEAVNNRGEVGGEYIASSDENYHAFFSVSLFEPKGATSAAIYGVNDKDITVGSYDSPANVGHGMVLKSPRLYITFDYPGGTNTTLTGINNSRLIGGYYYNGTVTSGFIAQLVR